jgi:hypothetical protein
MSNVQTPHCDGRNVCREIFSLEVAELDEERVLVLKQDSGWIMMAGQAHGVEKDTTVQLFATRALQNNEGLATITKIHVFRSEIQPPPGINADFLYARLRHSFALRVFASDSILDLANASIPSLQQSSDGIYATRALCVEDSHLTLTTESDGILVQLNAAQAAPDSVKDTKLFTAGHIRRIDDQLQPQPKDLFQWASHFMYHLLRPPPVVPLVSVELYAIKIIALPPARTHGNPIFEKFGENLIDPKTNLAEVNGTDHYGIILKNNDTVGYYPYIVSFDSDLEIRVSISILYDVL